MNGFHQAFKTYYEDLQERCRWLPGEGASGYNTALEDETFMAEFDITDMDYAGRILGAVHGGDWNRLDDLVAGVLEDYRICIRDKILNPGPEVIVI